MEAYKYILSPINLHTGLALSILLLPLISFLVLFFFAKKLPGKGDKLACAFTALSFVLSVVLLISIGEKQSSVSRFMWFSSSDHMFTVSIIANKFIALMVAVVTFVSLLVHLYSIEYMKGKRNYGRYFPYLGIFTFAMLGIVFSDNILITFIFWELVGFSSYLLIGFWYDKESAIKASKKAFLFNRIGDVGLLLAILGIFGTFNTFELGIVQAAIIDGGFDLSSTWFTLIGIGIFLGCVGKSAQFPLQVWLPDAMEGPTPVSALIHAATMVAAGIFLLSKTFVLLNDTALTIIATIGAVTAIVGALPALVQNDIKKVLAFSTISQLGYMVMGMGVQAYEASLFHLITHAFFKACLFLSAGAVIHGMHDVKVYLNNKGAFSTFDSQDMRLMGGFRKSMPVVFYTFLISSLSLIGIPFFSGFLSKDAILEAAWNWAEFYSADGVSAYHLVPLAGFLTVFITAFYMIRQLLMVFFGDFKLANILPGASEAFKKAVHTPLLIKLPTILLAILSLGFVFSYNPFSNSATWFFNWVTVPRATIHEMHKTGMHDVVPLAVVVASLVLAATGIFLAYYLYKPREVKTAGPVKVTFFPEDSFLQGLLKNNWYLDKLYYFTMVKSGLKIASVSHKADSLIIDPLVNFLGIFTVVFSKVIYFIDKYIVDGMVALSAYLSALVGNIFRAFQTGRVQGYIIFSICILVLLILLLLL